MIESQTIKRQRKKLICGGRGGQEKLQGGYALWIRLLIIKEKRVAAKVSISPFIPGVGRNSVFGKPQVIRQSQNSLVQWKNKREESRRETWAQSWRIATRSLDPIVCAVRSQGRDLDWEADDEVRILERPIWYSVYSTENIASTQ